MKKQMQALRLNKESISSLERQFVKGGAPTTGQSQYCPDPFPVPWTFTCPHSLDEAICTSRSCNSACYSRCNGC